MKIEQHFAGEPDSVREARRFVAEAVDGLPDILVDDIVLMVSELATNSVNHARSDFFVSVELEADTVRIEVLDRGSDLPRKRRPHVDEPYGRGLHIVETLSESWGVDVMPDGGKTIWIVVAIPEADVEALTASTGPLASVIGDSDDLTPRWLVDADRRQRQLVMTVVVPVAIGVAVFIAAYPRDVTSVPLLAAAFIVVPLLVALVAMARRIERSVEEVRKLDVGRRQQTRMQAELRRRAERTAAQAEAVLALGNVLATAHSVSAVAETALDELDIPAHFTDGSIAIVEDNHLHVIASRGATREAIGALEKVDLTRSPWLGDVLAGTPAYIEDRDEFAQRYPTALVLRMYASGSWLVVPFRAENTVGLLSLHYAEPQPLNDFRLYFSLVSELLGTSLERARSEEHQRQQHRELEQSFAERDRIARTLSTSLLPPALPRLRGFSAAGWLVPASSDEVSGDFYDLFAVSDGGWVAVLGDVCGKGAEAAAVTSLTRYAARAAALDNPDPAHVARVANQALVADPSDLFCTAAIVRYVPAEHHIEVTLAGHLQARLISNQTVTRLGTYGAALGLATSPPRVDRHALPDDAKVVLFSDGLVERDPDFGEREFDAFLASTNGSNAAELSAQIRTLLRKLNAVHRDDVAVLVVERSG